MLCPVCRSEMRSGAIRADGSEMVFITEKHNKHFRFVRLNEGTDEFCIASGVFSAAQVSAFYCRNCRKLIVDNVGP